MSPGKYTELFFLDEAVALAAGHRPCGECRRDDYRMFRASWALGNKTSEPDRKALDAALHAARVDPRTRLQKSHQAPCGSLPDGAFIRFGEPRLPHLVLGEALIPFENYSYGRAVSRPDAELVEVLTPLPTVAALRAGYSPSLHETVTSQHISSGRD